MPVVKLYQNGLTAGCPPRHVNQNPVPRGDCKGWSLRTSRGNTRFLYSVVSADLPVSADGRPLLGLSGSLTVGDCPPTHKDWIRVRRALIKRCERRGLYRLHWLTEWQKRGVPHLHFAAWFIQPDSDHEAAILPTLVKADWLQLTAPYRSSGKGQEVKPITDDVGWLQYLSKHASRGAAHYQRAMSTIPKGWQKTGRMWGHLGDFPTREPLGLELDDQGWFEFRRIVRGWRLAQARGRKSFSKDLGRRLLDEQIRRRRIKSARRMLQCKDPLLSRCRGVSEWIPLALGQSIVKPDERELSTQAQALKARREASLAVQADLAQRAASRREASWPQWVIVRLKVQVEAAVTSEEKVSIARSLRWLREREHLGCHAVESV